MKRRFLRSALAVFLALALLLPAALAEDAEANDIILVNGEEESNAASEAMVEELAGTLDALAGASDEAAPSDTAKDAVANDVPAAIELGVKQTYTLGAKALAPGKTITYKTSKSSVAAVSKKGVITAKKKGSATVRCYAGKTLLATCKVKVVAAPSSVSLGMKSATLGVGETLQLVPTITKGTLATFTWSTGNKKIATVSKAGLITGKKTGSTTITVKTQNGKSARLKVKVLKAPGKVTLSATSTTLEAGNSLKLTATLPKNTYSRITWTSSDESVVTVSADGRVTAVREGKAKIIATTFNNKKKACTVKVENAVTYRALLIGEVAFYPACSRNWGDVRLMESMLNSVRGLYGGKYAVSIMRDQNRDGVLEAIAATFAGADENDVSLFFIATHGDTGSSGRYAGALAMVPSGFLLLEDLASALKAVPGKVIVILESCGSGAAIYANNSKSAAPSFAGEANAKAFDLAAVRAFSAVDPGLVVEVQPNGLKSDGVVSNTGEFRLENKFYVLTASRYQEDSYGQEGWDPWNYFTYWLTSGIGTSGSMPADANRDGQATLNELYQFIADAGDNYPLYVDSEVYYQHVQVYPADSSYVLFTR